MSLVRKSPPAWVDFLWPEDPSVLPAWRRKGLGIARLFYALGQDLVSGDLTLKAMGLVYTSLLSLVPLLAVSFSVLKGFGVHNQLEPLLRELLDPMGAQGAEITDLLIGFVDKTQVAVLGSVGLALLIYSVISLISKVELVFNQIWHLKQSRSMIQRLSQYLSVLLVGPVLVFSALGLTASLKSNVVVDWLVGIQPLGQLVELLGSLVPGLLITLAFLFAYLLIPNTRVRLGPALLGALIAAVLWQLAGQVFATFMAGSTKYAAIYSGLAIAILFMIWVYIAWVILLIGVSIAFYRQHPEYTASAEPERILSIREREQLALALLTEIGRAHLDGGPQPDSDDLAKLTERPLIHVRRLLSALTESGLLIETRDDPERYAPARAPHRQALGELLIQIRQLGESSDRPAAGHPNGAIHRVGRRSEAALNQAFGDETLEDLILKAGSDAGGPD